MKLLKTLGITLFFLTFLSIHANASMSMTKTGYGVSSEYSNPSDIPGTIWYDDGTYRGTLYKTGYHQSSGSAATKITWYEPEYLHIAWDECIWNANTLYMNYVDTYNSPANSKVVTKDGYTFTAYSNIRNDGVSYTKYAASDMDPYRGKDNRPDEAWTGRYNVSHGYTYTTAWRYFYVSWYGEYNIPDTRKYQGDYSGTIYLYAPDDVSGSIKNSPYVKGNDYWFKSTDAIQTQVYVKDNNTDIQNAYTHIKQNGNMKFAVGANSGGGWVDENPGGRFTYVNAYRSDWNQPSNRERSYVYNFYAKDETDYDFMVHAINWRNIWAGGRDQSNAIDTGLNIRIDNTAPGLSNAYITNKTMTGFDVVVQKPDDWGRSGTKYVDLYFYYQGQWDVAGEWYRNTYPISDGDTKTIHIDYANIPGGANKFGNFTVDVRLYDNVGNGGQVLKSLSAFRNTPTPASDYINLYDYEYSNGGVYWVKSGDPFTARISGHINNPLSRYGISSEHLIIRQWGASNFNSIQAFDSGIDQYAAINTNQYSASVGTSTFPASKFTLNSGYGVRTSANYTDSVFNIKTDNTLGDFDLSPLIRINTPASGYWDSTWGIPNLRVKSDGIAPKADSVGITKQMVNELNLQINNLTDIGSGLNLEKLYMEVQPVNFSGVLVGVKEKSYNYTSLGNNNYSLRIDWNSCQNKTWYGKFKVQVYAFDYVGNSSCIYDKILDRQPLKIQGTIDPNPAQQGKNTGVTIRTEGSANRIKIVFPFEFRNLDSTLFIDKAINVEPSHIEFTNARVPLEVPLTLDESGNRLKDKYKVYIEAVNGYGEIVSGYLDLDIQGNILDDLKVRLRGTGYDKE